jgi:hypothetical protein
VLADDALEVVAFSAVAGTRLTDVLERLWQASQAVIAEERQGRRDEEWWVP